MSSSPPKTILKPIYPQKLYSASNLLTKSLENIETTTTLAPITFGVKQAQLIGVEGLNLPANDVELADHREGHQLSDLPTSNLDMVSPPSILRHKALLSLPALLSTPDANLMFTQVPSPPVPNLITPSKTTALPVANSETPQTVPKESSPVRVPVDSIFPVGSYQPPVAGSSSSSEYWGPQKLVFEGQPPSSAGVIQSLPMPSSRTYQLDISSESTIPEVRSSSPAPVAAAVAVAVDESDDNDADYEPPQKTAKRCSVSRVRPRPSALKSRVAQATRVPTSARAGTSKRAQGSRRDNMGAGSKIVTPSSCPEPTKKARKNSSQKPQRNKASNELTEITHDIGSSPEFKVRSGSVSKRLSDAMMKQRQLKATSVSRSHSGGCWTCKCRRKKCDERHPSCLACELLGLKCDGYSLKRPRFMTNEKENYAYRQLLASRVRERKSM